MGATSSVDGSLGKGNPALQADREKQIDGQPLIDGAGDFQVAFDGAGEQAEEEGEDDGGDEILNEEIHLGKETEVTGGRVISAWRAIPG